MRFVSAMNCIVLGEDGDLFSQRTKCVDLGSRYDCLTKCMFSVSITSIMRKLFCLVDPIVKLFTAIFKLAVLETRFLKSNLGTAFSPEVASTVLWFLKRFVKAYLVQSSESHLKLSPSLTALFGKDSECGKWLVASILEVIEENLRGWCAETQVSDDVVRLLLRLVSDKTR